MDRQRVRQLPAFDLRKRMKYQINKTLIVSLDLWLKSPLFYISDGFRFTFGDYSKSC